MLRLLVPEERHITAPRVGKCETSRLARRAFIRMNTNFGNALGFLDSIQDLLMLGESMMFVFGKNKLAINDNIKHSTATPDQVRLDVQLLSQFGRQTGGPGTVVSLHAVSDRDFHASSRPAKRINDTRKCENCR